MSAETVRLRTTIEPDKEIEVSLTEARDLEVLGLVYTPEEPAAEPELEDDEAPASEAAGEETLSDAEDQRELTEAELEAATAPDEAPASEAAEPVTDEAPKKKGRS